MLNLLKLILQRPFMRDSKNLVIRLENRWYALACNLGTVVIFHGEYFDLH